MQYGNLSAGSLDIEPYVEELNASLENGIINEDQYKRRLRSLKRDKLLFIAITNNMKGQKTKTRRKLSITDFKDLIHDTKVEEFVDKLRIEEEARKGTDGEFTEEDLKKAEEFIANLKKLEESKTSEFKIDNTLRNLRKERKSRNQIASKSRLKNKRR